MTSTNEPHGGSVFPDADLTVVKEELKNREGMDFETFEIEEDKLEAILARMKAAEDTINYTITHCCGSTYKVIDRSRYENG